MKLYYGKVFRGSKITDAMVLNGVVMGHLSNGRTFIVAARDLNRFTFVPAKTTRDMLNAA